MAYRSKLLARSVLCVLATCAASLACSAPSKDPGPDFQIVGESVRLRSTDPVPKTSPYYDGTQITLRAARGELLGFQIYNRAPAPVSVALAADVRLYEVHRATAKRASTQGLYGNGSRGAGDWPDVLVESKQPATNPVYVELTATSSVKGTVTAGERAIPITVEVVDVSLPQQPPRVWAYYDPRELVWAGLGKGTHDAPSAEERACIATFRRYGVMLTPDLPVSAWPARKELLAGFPWIPTKISKDPATVGADVRAWIDATRGTGQLPFSIPIDEPRKPEQRAKVKALARAVREAGGGPSSFLYAVTDEPRAEYEGLIDLYITLRPKLADKHTRWTYNGGPPRAGAMTLDAHPPGPRTWGWLAHRYNIPLWYVWDALYWHDRHNRKGAPLPGRALDWRTDATSFTDGEDFGNLDGVLAVPGDAQTPCRPTLRLASIGRGQQDRALIDLATKCDAVATAKLVEQLVPRGFADTSSTTWPRDELKWEEARRRLLDLARCSRP